MPTVVASWRRGDDLVETYKLRGCSPGAAAGALAAGAALWAAVTAAEALRGGAAGDAELLLTSAAPAAGVFRGAGLPVALATAGVAGPLAEELMFRGLLLSALGRAEALGGFDRLVASGFAFAVIHLDPAGLLRFTLLGTSCALAATRTGSLLPAVLLHAGHNCAALLAAFR